MDYALRVSGLTLPAELHRTSLGSRRDSPGDGLRCRQLPLTSREAGGLLALPALRIPDAQFRTKTPGWPPVEPPRTGSWRPAGSHFWGRGSERGAAAVDGAGGHSG